VSATFRAFGALMPPGGLDLPKEPSADEGVPFRDVLRNAGVQP